MLGYIKYVFVTTMQTLLFLHKNTNKKFQLSNFILSKCFIILSRWACLDYKKNNSSIAKTVSWLMHYWLNNYNNKSIN